MEKIRLVGLIAVLWVAPVACQDAHPTKQIYLDFASFPVMTPGEVQFAERFRPFRAVWSREYRNMDGEMREDRVILVAEQLSWYGRPVLSATYHDAGSPTSPDTNARTATVYLDLGTLELVRAIVPKSGTAEDYNVVSVGSDGIVTTSVSTSSGEAVSTVFEADGAVFGPTILDFLVWAGLPLEPDQPVVVPNFSPDSNDTGLTIVRVLGTEDVRLPGGQTATARVVERPIPQPENARMHHFRLLDRPPYLVSRHVIDLDSGDTSFHLALVEWELLDGS